MVTPNYRFAKRQRDMEKKRKQEQKRQRKRAEKDAVAGGVPGDTAEAPPAGDSSAKT